MPPEIPPEQNQLSNQNPNSFLNSLSEHEDSIIINMQQFGRRGFIQDVLQNTELPEAKPRTINPTTPEKEHRMSALIRTYLVNRNQVESLQGLSNERRESEYIDFILSDKRRNLTEYEVVESETPVHLESLDYNLILNIAKRGHSDLVADGEGLKAICNTCSTHTYFYHAFFCLGKVYCVEHLPVVQECISCHRSRPDCTEVMANSGNKIHVCVRCVSRLRCACSVRIRPEEAEFMQCKNCFHASGRNQSPRPYSRNENWLSKDTTPLVQSNRIFSCEIETCMPNQVRIDRLLLAIPTEIGIVSDASIRNSGNTYGVELQSPRLQGSRGEELVKRLVAALKAFKASVNDSCGFHIHLDAVDLLPQKRDEYPKALIQLWKAHLVFEDIILSFLPYKRRSNRYCRPMRDYFKLSELSLLTSVFDIEKLWYKQRSYTQIGENKAHHYHPSRYFGFNLHSLLSERNLEIRYHTGTLNAKKILHWVSLHSLIMDAARNRYFDSEFLEEALATTDLKEKTQMLFGRIGISANTARYFLERQRKFADKSQVEDEGTPVVSAPRLPPLGEYTI